MTRTIRFILNAIRLARKPSRAVPSARDGQSDCKPQWLGADAIGGAADLTFHSEANTDA